MAKTTRKICYTALMMAITFIMITIIRIPIPKGYIHFGDAAVFLSAYILGPGYGIVAAGIGASAADYFSGFSIYVIPTFIAKSVMVVIAGNLLKGNTTRKKQLATMAAASIIMAFIYYIAECLIYGNILSPIVDIPFNLLQAAVGIVIAILLFNPLAPFRFENLPVSKGDD